MFEKSFKREDNYMDPKNMVYKFIVKKLASGELEEGARVKEQYLVNNLGISRTPVREALVELASEGVLIREPRKGFRIKSYTKEDLVDLFDYIGLLTGKCGQLVCPSMRKIDLAKMRFLTDSMTSAVENCLYNEYNDLFVDFHEVYLLKCDNEFLEKELARIRFLYLGRISLFFDESKDLAERYHEVNVVNQELVNLFEKREADEIRFFLENDYWTDKKVDRYFKRE